MVEAIDVQRLVKAVKVATSRQLPTPPETKSQSVPIFPDLGHLVVVEGTMLLNMR